MAQKMLDLLVDGEPHGIDELVALFDDTEADNSNVHPHLNVVRKHLQSKRMSVLAEGLRGTGRKVTYRIVAYWSAEKAIIERKQA